MHTFETIIGRFLQFGVLISASSIGLGLIGSWFRSNPNGFEFKDMIFLSSGREIHESLAFDSLNELWFALTTGDATAWITAGILILVLLPIMRVILTGAIFLYQRDYLFFGISALVLTTLSIGLYLGKGL